MMLGHVIKLRDRCKKKKKFMENGFALHLPEDIEKQIVSGCIVFNCFVKERATRCQTRENILCV